MANPTENVARLKDAYVRRRLAPIRGQLRRAAHLDPLRGDVFSTEKSAKQISGGGDKNARAAGLAPDTLIDAPGLCPIVVAGIERLVVDPQLPVQEI
jgi:hypothetical protein